MELKPIFQTETIKFSAPVLQSKKLETKVVSDPDGTIPNGIYRVIHWEKIRQLVTIVLSGLLLIFSSILIALYTTTWKSSWAAFIVPILLLLCSFYKFFSTISERKHIISSVLRYREDLKVGLSSTPPFISKMYFNLHLKQIRHNWITFTLIFYGGIFVLMLWWLKDVSWWIFEFSAWIHALFSDPDVMVYLFTVGLLSIVVLHIIMSIQRKKRILDINSYFGSSLMSETEMLSVKEKKNKQYRRIFLLSLLILLVIPIVIRISLKILKRKK